MPKKFPFVLLIICYLLLAWPVHVLAITTTPAISVASSQTTCDLCGWCNQTIEPKPPDWNKCYACLYDAAGNEVKGSYYTIFGCLSTKPEFFVKSMLSIVFGMSGGIAFLAVLAGSAILLTSSGNPEKLQTGKDILTSSIFGLLLIIFSVFLLRVVGFDILRIPGFG